MEEKEIDEFVKEFYKLCYWELMCMCGSTDDWGHCLFFLCFLLQVGFSSAGMRLLAKEGNQEASVAPPVTFLSPSVPLCPHNHRDKVSLPRFAFEFLLSRCRMRNSAADARCPHTYINDVIIHTNTWSAAATNYNLHATPISNCAPSAELTMCWCNVPGTWCKYDIGNYINVSYLHVQT